MICLDHFSPMDIDPAGSPVARADPILPMIIVGEAAAWPAEHWWFQPAQGFDDIRAEAAYVGEGRIFTDPDAVIDAATEVLDEMTVDIRIDGGECISRIQSDASCVHFGLPISSVQP
jgi:hypothetical protein